MYKHEGGRGVSASRIQDERPETVTKICPASTQHAATNYDRIYSASMKSPKIRQKMKKTDTPLQTTIIHWWPTHFTGHFSNINNIIYY